ncbi:ANKL1 protein, partial [Brachypteracias leptosomus]|nr:ANKL1 protein [Brachypteracias leptosomus]
ATEELTPLHVAASRGCRRCLGLLLKKRGDPELPDQDGRRALALALEKGTTALVQIPRDPQHTRGWPLKEEPGVPRCPLSFLTEDGTDGNVSSGLPLSSTRQSLLEELGGGCDLGDPLLCRGCPPSLAIPSLTPWPRRDPRGSALPPHPLASSTLLSDGDQPEEGPQSWIVGRVLLVPEDHGHPQNSPLDAQGSSGSSPTVLLVPGDHGHPQNSPLDAQGSPGSSPTVLLVPGDRGHPQVSPSDAQGSPGSSPMILLPGGSVVPLSPTSCSPHHTGENLRDEEQGRAPPEWHSPGTEAATSPTRQEGQVCPVPPRPLSDEGLRRRLRALGGNPGPITELTRGFPELVAALQSGRVPDCAQDELVLVQLFDRPDRSRHWREGLVKSSFNYLLLDPRTTQNLPLRCHRLSPAECFRTFVKSIFYVGKGTRARPYCHLTQALSQHRAGTQRGCPKVRRILEIWAGGQGVVSLHCFQSSLPEEAYTREGCLLEALGLQTLTNQRRAKCYGLVASWPGERRRRLGVHLLHRAMSIFLAEGERQLRPLDIQGGR